MAAARRAGADVLRRLRRVDADAAADWDDIAWLREQWGGPFMVKGIMHPDDARRAVDIGADAISVSNHGGNNLDGTPASIRALPAVVEAVGDEIEVLLDGGIRRGSDVVKALALGARAVMIGRAYLWGMAANGEAGVDERARDPARRDRRDARRPRPRVDPRPRPATTSSSRRLRRGVSRAGRRRCAAAASRNGRPR